MKTFSVELIKYQDGFHAHVVEVWERSVRATHDFVSPEDIDYFKTIVQGIDFHAFEVYCAVHEGQVLGFIGVAEQKVEMLFLDPDFMGKGIGKQLMDFAMNSLHAIYVDVNEQNLNAVKFYEKLGFETYKRMEKDSEGKDYPILKMKLSD
ncbi:MAG: GNAT family N-acetyltransferase [Saprospiraceae bacterium]|nr:GNAT family N-acetyltransferase [Saprospiraceae bacterium]